MGLAAKSENSKSIKYPTGVWDATLIQLDFGSKESAFFPAGLIALATDAKDSGYKIGIVDLNLSRLHLNKNTSDTISELICPRLGVFGISVFYGLLLKSLKIARQLKQRFPDCTIVLGGPGVFEIEEPTIKRFSHYVDFVVRGEGEEPFRRILDNIARGGAGDIPNAFRYDRQTHLVCCGQDVGGESVRPVPKLDYSLIDLKTYLRYQESSELPIIAGYGCPRVCSFCSTNRFWKQKYRVKAVSDLVNEMKHNHELFGVTHFALVHDNLFVSEKVISEFESGFKDIPFSWSSTIRLDKLSETLPQKLKKMGCRSLAIGIESASNRLQSSINKKLELNDAIELIDSLQRENIHLTLSYILDLPGSSRADNIETLNLAFLLAAKHFNIQTQINRVVFLNGSEIYSQRHGFTHLTSVDLLSLIKYCSKTIPKTISHLSSSSGQSILETMEWLLRESGFSGYTTNGEYSLLIRLSLN
ncbi:radical SAM protein [Bdellovibrionota bacterium FG-2]